MFKLKKEFVVTISIFCFLLIAIIISVEVVYKNYNINKSLLSGKILCAQIMSASINYYRKNGNYLVNDKVSFNDNYIDARTNPYFSVFSTYPIDDNKQGISVFGTVEGTDYEIKLVFNNDAEPIPLKNLKTQIIKIKKNN